MRSYGEVKGRGVGVRKQAQLRCAGPALLAIGRRRRNARCASSFQIFNDDKALETAIDKIRSFTSAEDARGAEERRGMVVDPYAEALLAAGDASRQASSPSTSDRNTVNLSTQYLDDCILRALESKSFIKQVVLFGSNLETRPYRLGVPSGTILFDVCPESVHEYKMARLKEERVAQGCLHVPIAIPRDTPLEEVEALVGRRGFQGSKPSLWALQGIDQYCRDERDFEEVVVHLSKWMARDSILMGSIAGKRGSEVKEILAGCMLQGDAFSLEDYAAAFYSGSGEESLEVNEDVSLFYATQTGRSIAERDIYQTWTKMAEEVGDEDHFDNFQ